MQNLPTPKLGNVSAVTIATPNLETSFAFYEKLGFTESARADMPFPWIQITDGALLIMLRKQDEPYIALTYYTADIDKTVATLEAAGIVFAVKPGASDMVKRSLFQSPDGLNISLVTFFDVFKQPEGPTMLSMDPAALFDPGKYVNKICGVFGEFAHPVTDLDASIAFWGKLGFVVLSKMTTPYNWAILSDGLNIVGLHQTTTFTYPVITYFAADMKAKIANLKSAGINNFTEKAGESNITLITPEQQYINLFTLGM